VKWIRVNNQSHAPSHTDITLFDQSRLMKQILLFKKARHSVRLSAGFFRQ
jgi:hypothetical protein